MVLAIPMVFRLHFCLVPDLLSISVPTSGAPLAAPHVYPHAFFPLVAAEQWFLARERVLTRARWCLDTRGTSVLCWLSVFSALGPGRPGVPP